MSARRTTMGFNILQMLCSRNNLTRSTKTSVVTPGMFGSAWARMGWIHSMRGPQHMASNLVTIQHPHVALYEVKVPYAHYSHSRTQTTWHWYRCVSGATDVRNGNVMETRGADVFQKGGLHMLSHYLCHYQWLSSDVHANRADQRQDKMRSMLGRH